MHHWTSFLLTVCYSVVLFTWYNSEPITCKLSSNLEAEVTDDYHNVCLSYPYVEEENGDRRYLLFYRWTSYTFIVLAAIYSIPRKIKKNFDNEHITKLLNDLANEEHTNDEMEKTLVQTTTKYMQLNRHTHNSLFCKFLFLNAVALVIDISAMFILNFLLQGNFLWYGTEAYPFQKDPEHFTDKMSKLFPPFVECEIAQVHKLIRTRNEIYGCHLTMMELYEKVFLGLWAWLLVLIVITFCYIIFLLSMLLPFIQERLLRAAKPVHAPDKNSSVIPKVVKHCKIGDIYLLYQLKSHLTRLTFYELMENISDFLNPQDRTRSSAKRGDSTESIHLELREDIELTEQNTESSML